MEDQQQAIALFSDAQATGQPGPAEQMETHISRIFLAGDRVWKMKRAVKLPYADFSTPQLRLAACRKEVELNAPTAPNLYLGVRRITRASDGSVGFDGDGEMIDAVVEMRRFDQSALLNRMAAAGELTPALMTRVARMIAGFHRTAPIVRGVSGSANIAAVLDINRAGFEAAGLFSQAEVGGLDAAFRRVLLEHAVRLDRRELAGKVRRCHGDLHLRNICMLGGEPRLFDCIEFNDAIATIDVLYDLAFLLMDLWHQGLVQLANLVANRYLDTVDEEGGFVLLPFFMAVRAAVRAHVGAAQAKSATHGEAKLEAEARTYFELAGRLLHAPASRMVVIGGLSGSGKSTVADALAPHVGAPPGARIVESDRIRKAIHQVPAETRLPDEAYSAEMSQKVYAEMARHAAHVLGQGACVVADAVFDRQTDREAMERVAAKAKVPFEGLWLEANEATLRSRVGSRASGSSDATVEILSRQLQRMSGGVSWRHLDATRPTAEIVEEILGEVSTAA